MRARSLRIVDVAVGLAGLQVWAAREEVKVMSVLSSVHKIRKCDGVAKSYNLPRRDERTFVPLSILSIEHMMMILGGVSIGNR